jgi:hypothetical protein
VTEEGSCDHFQPEMGFLGSAGRQYTKKKYFQAKVCYFEEGFYEQKTFFS